MRKLYVLLILGPVFVPLSRAAAKITIASPDTLQTSFITADMSFDGSLDYCLDPKNPNSDLCLGHFQKAILARGSEEAPPFNLSEMDLVGDAFASGHSELTEKLAREILSGQHGVDSKDLETLFSTHSVGSGSLNELEKLNILADHLESFEGSAIGGMGPLNFDLFSESLAPSALSSLDNKLQSLVTERALSYDSGSENLISSSDQSLEDLENGDRTVRLATDFIAEERNSSSRSTVETPNMATAFAESGSVIPQPTSPNVGSGESNTSRNSTSTSTASTPPSTPAASPQSNTGDSHQGGIATLSSSASEATTPSATPSGTSTTPEDPSSASPSIATTPNPAPSPATIASPAATPDTNPTPSSPAIASTTPSSAITSTVPAKNNAGIQEFGPPKSLAPASAGLSPIIVNDTAPVAQMEKPLSVSTPSQTQKSSTQIPSSGATLQNLYNNAEKYGTSVGELDEAILGNSAGHTPLDNKTIDAIMKSPETNEGVRTAFADSQNDLVSSPATPPKTTPTPPPTPALQADCASLKSSLEEIRGLGSNPTPLKSWTQSHVGQGSSCNRAHEQFKISNTVDYQPTRTNGCLLVECAIEIHPVSDSTSCYANLLGKEKSDLDLKQASTLLCSKYVEDWSLRIVPEEKPKLIDEAPAAKDPIDFTPGSHSTPDTLPSVKINDSPSASPPEAPAPKRITPDNT